MLRDTH